MSFENMCISLYSLGNLYPLLSRRTVLIDRFITVRKRSLRQGNVFTRVCHSVHRWGGVCLQGVCNQGDLPQGGLHPWGVCLQVGLHPRRSA